MTLTRTNWPDVDDLVALNTESIDSQASAATVAAAWLADAGLDG